MIIATMDDLKWIDNLFRKKYKKNFPTAKIRNFIYRIKRQEILISDDRKFCEVVKIYQKKTTFGDKKNKIIAYPGDIKLWYAASLIKYEGLGVKYQKEVIEIMKKRTHPSARFFASPRSDNESSKKFIIKSGLRFYKTYIKNNISYDTFILEPNIAFWRRRN